MTDRCVDPGRRKRAVATAVALAVVALAVYGTVILKFLAR